MSDGEQQFIDELRKRVHHHELKQGVILEYEQHIYEMKQKIKEREVLTYEKIANRLGTPKSIAKM